MTRTCEYSFACSRLEPSSSAADRLEHFERLIPYGVDRVDRRRQQYRTDVGWSHAARPHGFADRTIAELRQAERALSVVMQTKFGEDLDLLQVTVLDLGQRDGVSHGVGEATEVERLIQHYRER
jgi:hypothetical protein